MLRNMFLIYVTDSGISKLYTCYSCSRMSFPLHPVLSTSVQPSSPSSDFTLFLVCVNLFSSFPDTVNSSYLLACNTLFRSQICYLLSYIIIICSSFCVIMISVVFNDRCILVFPSLCLGHNRHTIYQLISNQRKGLG